MGLLMLFVKVDCDMTFVIVVVKVTVMRLW